MHLFCSRLLRLLFRSVLVVGFSFQASAALLHRYSFTADASDSIGSEHGTLQGGATISGGAVVLDGSSGYVDLPNGLVSTLTSITLETWLTDNNSGTWSRIFDFGNSTAGEDVPATGTQYLVVTPQTGGGNLRATINAGSGEQLVDWAGTRLPTGSLKHVVWTSDGPTQTGRLYVDGVLVGENLAMTLTPADMGFTLNNWIGRSQFSADAYLNASVTEFRIYDTTLTAAEVQQNFTYGPDVAALDGIVSVLTQPQSQSVVELSPVTFTVSYAGTPPVSVQWLRNNVPIAGATNDTYTIASVALTNNGSSYRAALTNTYNSVTAGVLSSNAVLTVVADTNAPVLVRAASLFPSEVLVTFSEGVSAVTGTNLANYTLTHAGGALGVTAARFGGTTAEIVLTTAPQVLGTQYTLTVNNVRDRAAAANLIAANSQTNFIATAFVGVDIGAPASGGVLAPVIGGVNLTASGSGVSGTSDQFSLAYRSYTNDFDLEVRLAGLTFASAWTRAGLMARDGLATNALFAASFATPGPAGCHFESRATVGGSAVMAGQFPVNYPDTWLRLRRVGNAFSGFASLDGQSWEFLGAATLTMSNVVQVGLAVTAGNSTGSATAQFRDYATGSGNTLTNAPLPFEPLGPCSRRTPLVISEIMFNPPDAWGGTNNLEYIELWNSGLVTEDLTGHKLSGDISFQFPDGTKLAPGQFLVVAKDPAAAQNFYGIAGLGPYTNKLSNGGGTLRLRNELGGILLEIDYDTKAPWPVAPDGTGHSLVLSRPSYGENDPRAWAASDAMGGSPGAFEPYGNEPARGVVINEFLAHTDLPQVDYLELFNSSTQAVNLSGAWLSDVAGTNKFRIPDGTTIAARGFLAYTDAQLGFSLSADGEAIYLVNSNQTRVLDAVKFDGQENGVSMGRYPDGAPGFQPLATVTLGTANTPPRVRQLVINEIMYRPISGLNDDEYLELYNRGPGALALGGWKLQGGVGFTFPSNAVIAAGGYLVVAENLTNLLAKYPQLNATNTFGNYSGSLADGGERIALAMPDDLISTNAQGVVTTNIFYITMDEVTYSDGGRWGKWSDGGGSSLELIDPDADNRLAANWADSDESAKAAWTTINVTNVMENGQTGQVNEGSGSYGIANRFEVFLQGPGEALLDSVEFHSNGGASLLSNGSFDANTVGWTLGGVMRSSYAQAGVGVGGSQALHLVATDRGDTGPNKIFSALTSTAATVAPNTGNIRASVRWLKGSPYILFRIRGNWMEVSQRLNVPTNCGTPGLPNSRVVANAGPAITDVSHTPILPAAGQSVMVSARASDSDGIGSLQLRYRVDPSATYTTVAMTNDLGVYRAAIPGQAAGTLGAFVISATDALGATNQFPAEAPTRECLVRWGETIVPGTIGTYRLWVTAANISFWGSREKNANDPLDATFVYGNSRVIYNVNTLYSGSPFHAPGYDGPLGTMACDYEINFNPDERFLGSEPFVLTAFDVVSGSFFMNDDSAQVDLTGNWIARKLGQPFNYRRHVHVIVNGLRRGTIYDDAQQPNSEVLAEYFPDDTHGQLRKIESWFEFADDGVNQGSVYTTIRRYNKSTGEIDPKRYRWNWRPRATDDPDDWAPLTNLIAVVNDSSSPNYEARVRSWMDVRNFLGPIITHHICGSWDSYAYSRGKNMYAYKPDGEGWRLLMWDIEIALGAGGDGATTSIYTMFDSTLLNMIQSVPAFQREYLAGFQDAVDTTLAPGVADVLLNERYANFQLNSVPLISPQFIKTWIAARRAYLLTILPKPAFAVTSPVYQAVSSSNTVTLTGTAPLGVATILINSNAYPVIWTTVTNWSVVVPLAGGTNVLAVSAEDRNGNTITNATGTATVNYTGSVPAAEGNVLFSEIQPQPAVEGAGFVELFNAHPNFTFDLSGWRINGLSYTFPAGAKLAPRSYLVLADNRFVYGPTYGLTNVAFDNYAGELDPAGETLTLFRTGSSTNEIVVDRVRYEAAAPWPAATNGSSLQLVDATQDNSRVANWGVQLPVTNILNPTPQWTYFTQTGVLPGSSTRMYFYLGNAGEIYLDDLTLVSGSVPGSGANLLSNGNFESALSGTWTISADFAGSALSTTIKHAGNSSLRLVATAGGSGNGDAIQQNFASTLPAGGTYSLSFWYLQNSTGTPLVVRLSNSTVGSGIYVTFDPRVPAATTNITLGATPGAANSVATNLPPFPPLWLNELQANNVTGPGDNFSQRDPWAEIFNPSGTNVNLNGCYLTDTYTNLTKWAFPASATASNGFTLLWCDNQTNQTTAAALHTGLSLTTGAGRLALTRIINGSTQVLDYLHYTNLPANWSYGSVPDGQPFYRDPMFYATPGATNNGASAPLTVFFNEWMADNLSGLTDPADGNYEDWFELYNPGTNAVDLGGYYLTDNLTNKFQFDIPNNGHYVIPAHGYLLVWADNESGQNSTNRADLHVNFALAKGGEAIGLFAADGTTIDAVTFGAQTSDVSEGRFPNGAANVYAMPTPTPRAANLVPNTPPLLAAISNRFLTLGQTLSLTVSATDTDVPPQSISYSFAGAPSGAQISSLGGKLTWTPAAAPATNRLSIVAADNGTPSLSVTQSFTVIVVLPPTLGGAVVNGSDLSFTWQSVPGELYQIEYKDDLNDPEWIASGPVQLGTGGALSFSTPISGVPHRYFRVRVLTLAQAMVLPPVLGAEALNASQLVLSWPTLPGQRFQLEARTNLASGNWNSVGAPLTGSGEVLRVTNEFATAPQRWFRVCMFP